MTSQSVPDYLWTLFNQLQRRHFALGPDDFDALRSALRAGFGWSSPEALRDLCSALWAKSLREKETLEALFDELDMPIWTLPQQERPTPAEAGTKAEDEFSASQDKQPSVLPKLTDSPEPSPPEPDASPLAIATYCGLPPISLSGVVLPNHHFVLVPQFHLTYRQVAQVWRRLRQPIREGPRTELDVEATVTHRCRMGVVSDVVLVPRRRNTSRLLLLVDREGSMTPFHNLVNEVCAAIQQAGNLEDVATYYFHDVPNEGANETMLEALPEQLFPILDPVLSEIAPLSTGNLYSDPHVTTPRAVSEVLRAHATGAAVVIISDAGAARGHYDLVRLLDTVAFLKTLGSYTQQIVWLNPLPAEHEGHKYWANNSAAQIARHVPMLPLDQAGMYQAVNILRGHPALIERPL